MHSGIMPIIPDKGLVLVGEVDERASNSRVVLDPDAHEAGGTKEGTYVGEGLAWRPIADLGNLRVIRNTAVVIALVT